MPEGLTRRGLGTTPTRSISYVGRLVSWAGIILALASPLLVFAFLVGTGPPGAMWRGEATPVAIGHAITLLMVVAATALMLGGLAIAAAGWGIGSSAVAQEALLRAERSIESYAEAEKARVRRFELLYGRLFAEVENLRGLFERAYVAIPGPKGTLMKAPIELGERRLLDAAIERRVPERALDHEAWIPRDCVTRFMGAGHYTLRDLALSDPEALARATELSEGEVHRLVRVARLFAVPGMETDWATALVDAGVTSVADLASRDPAPLAAIAADTLCRDIPASACLERITEFIREAQVLWREETG